MTQKIPSMGPWPFYSEDEVSAARRVLESGKVNYWTGTECREFEKEFAASHGAKYGIALANGTLALELALRVLGVGPGDEVIVTPRSFFASASCIVLSGATPVFVDIDPDSQNITASSIAAAITDKTAAVIAVHLAGWPCDMPAIMNLAHAKNIFVIEDCAQAHGARIDGQPVGSFGHAAAFSFCQDKIMSTAGEGGMMVTNDKTLWSKGWSFKDHGKSHDRVFSDSHPPGFRWLHESIGTNWRLTEIQGAIGRLQLAKLDEWVRLRGANARRLREGLSGIAALRIPLPSENIEHAYYKFYAFVDGTALRSGWSRDRILRELGEAGCPGLSGSCPEIYREGAFTDQLIASLPVASRIGGESIMLPIHPGIGQNYIDFVIGVLNDVFARAV